MGASNRSFQIVNIDTARVVYAGFSGVMQRPRQSDDPIYSFRVLAAVRKFLEENGIDTNFFDNSQYIRNTKAGMLYAFRAEMNSDVRDTERLAVTVDMIMGYNAYTRSHLR